MHHPYNNCCQFYKYHWVICYYDKGYVVWVLASQLKIWFLASGQAHEEIIHILILKRLCFTGFYDSYNDLVLIF